jgi:lysophospholipase L1-like esterase
MFKFFYYFLLFFLFVQSFAEAQTKSIPFNNKNIAYEGRINYTKDCAELLWSGTSVTINFVGNNITAILKDADTSNYYNVIIDGVVTSKIHTDTTKQNYVLASGLTMGMHKLQLFKRTECAFGKTYFYGFVTTKPTKLLAKEKSKKRKIEFYGNSITCGYGVEDNSGKDAGIGYFENNYDTYAAITARYYNAQYSCIARSGIGITISWFPQIMPEMYNRLDAADSTSIWNFKKYTPDVVVINLLQNDSWLVNMPEHEQFKNRFGNKKPTEQFIVDAYKKFVQSIREKYRNAHIICALGNMDATKPGSVWPVYIKKAIAEMYDQKIHAYFFKYKATKGHPSKAEQQNMATELIGFIDKKIKW